ncbi:MAG: DUF2339 domain-containing protein [Brucellaceae bacterium]|nr:DUF2339 domain-containing protein [Brucellaceae bacterium]
MPLPVVASADIPGILTGAGAIAAFATLYAAHALYGFVGPGVAFVGLTLIGLASLALSAVHGPKLAAIGLLGAYATPLLVDSDDAQRLRARRARAGGHRLGDDGRAAARLEMAGGCRRRRLARLGDPLHRSAHTERRAVERRAGRRPCRDLCGCLRLATG